MREFTFVIRLKRKFGQRVGLNFDSNMSRLLVIGVELRELIDKWNAANPSDAVYPGDLVVGVNEKETPEEMLEEIGQRDVLEITVTRPHGGLEHLDVCHNSVTLQGVEE